MNVDVEGSEIGDEAESRVLVESRVLLWDFTPRHSKSPVYRQLLFVFKADVE